MTVEKTTVLDLRVNADQATAALNQVARRIEDAVSATTRRGTRTTEFWVTAATIAAVLCTTAVELLAARTDGVSRAIVISISVLSAALAAAGYSAARARTKEATVAVTRVTPVPPAG